MPWLNVCHVASALFILVVILCPAPITAFLSPQLQTTKTCSSPLLSPTQLFAKSGKKKKKPKDNTICVNRRARRNYEILDTLEEGVPRGPYSGCLGYIGVNGAMDMNIVIRTAVVTPLPQVGSWQVSVGAGGAITILSESEDEYDEMILKASAVMKAVDEWAGGEYLFSVKNGTTKLVQEGLREGEKV